MQFKRLNRDQPEQIFMTVQNNEGAALNVDDCVCWETAAASVDGVKVRQMDTGLLAARVGLMAETLADQAYGLVQIWGYRPTCRIYQTNASLATGSILVGVAGSAALTAGVVSTDGVNLVATLGESFASSSVSGTVSRKIFLRAM